MRNTQRRMWYAFSITRMLLLSGGWILSHWKMIIRWCTIALAAAAAAPTIIAALLCELKNGRWLAQSMQSISSRANNRRCFSKIPKSTNGLVPQVGSRYWIVFGFCCQQRWRFQEPNRIFIRSHPTRICCFNMRSNNLVNWLCKKKKSTISWRWCWDWPHKWKAWHHHHHHVFNMVEICNWCLIWIFVFVCLFVCAKK